MMMMMMMMMMNMMVKTKELKNLTGIRIRNHRKIQNIKRRDLIIVKIKWIT